MVPFLSHVRRCGGALILTGIPSSPGKAIFLSGSGKVFGSVLDPVGIWVVSILVARLCGSMAIRMRLHAESQEMCPT